MSVSAGESVVRSVCDLSRTLASRHLLQGVGGVYMRQAVAELVYHVSQPPILLPRHATGEVKADTGGFREGHNWD